MHRDTDYDVRKTQILINCYIGRLFRFYFSHFLEQSTRREKSANGRGCPSVNSTIQFLLQFWRYLLQFFCINFHTQRKETLR